MTIIGSTMHNESMAIAAKRGEELLKKAIGNIEQLGLPEEWEKPDAVEYVPMKPMVETINAYRAKTAHDLLLEAADTLQDRGKERDKPGGERSMYRAVQIFNAIHPESALTEIQGWRFMQCLKLAREVQGGFKEDDYLDGIGYAALKAECAILEPK